MRAPPISSIDGLVKPQRLQRMLLRCRPDQHDQAAQQDAERDRGEHRGQHHLAGHLAHQQRRRPGRRRRGSARPPTAIATSGWPANSEAVANRQIGAEHHQLAVREVQHAAHAIDQHVAAADQRIDRRQHDDVDDELHGLTLSRSCRASSASGIVRPRILDRRW